MNYMTADERFLSHASVKVTSIQVMDGNFHQTCCLKQTLDRSDQSNPRYFVIHFLPPRGDHATLSELRILTRIDSRGQKTTG